MPNTYYEVTDSYIPSTAEHLLYMSLSTYETNWKSIPHTHSFTELFYVIEGDGFLLTAQKKIRLKPHDLIIMNPHIQHTETSSLSHKLTYIVLGVDNLKFHFPDDNGFLITNSAAHPQKILPLLQLMLEELRCKSKFYSEISHSYLAALLLKIQRMTNCDMTPYDSLPIPPECETIKTYIDSHYQDFISLDSLSNLVHWDKFYIGHMFTKAFGISPINYLLERRILNSKELLKSTDLNILQVAESTGFSSQNYFSQSFKKYTGETPLAYRKRHKKSVSSK